MKKLLLSTLMLALHFVFGLSANARTVSLEEAKTKAQRFYANAKDPALRARGAQATTFKLAYEARTANKSASCFYVLNQTHSQGFIIISADDRLPEVLGYSDSGDFDIDQIPDNMKWWLSGYERQIEQVLSSADADIATSTEHREGWTPIEPLVKTTWNQGAPYNNLCPAIDGQKTWAGCVATAMAQIMNYHQWPVTGRGSHSYEWNGQTLSMDFSTLTFDWANMQDTYSGTRDSEEAQNAVATLMLACGITANVDYGVDESGGYSFLAYKALFDYFDYDADYLYRSDIETSEWENLIYNELTNQRPVYYSGRSETSGHAFVCDGYSNDGLFHINWGWGGSYDGYFLLDVLDPRDGRGGYSEGQSIIYGISPNGEEAIRNGIVVNAENFPDNNFRNYLLEHEYAKDGVLIEAEIKRMENFDISNRNISDLKGIEHFTALTDLTCNDNQLASLNVSGCTALRYLNCSNNQLTSLDVSNNTALTDLSCGNNQLTSLDVSNNTALGSLWCVNNQLPSLDVSGCTALAWFYCYNNQLTSLNVSGCTALVRLQCYDNQLTSLDVSGCTALTYLYCDNNQLESLDVSGCTALTELHCYDSQLASLNVSGCTALESLSLSNNQLTSLDVSGCTALTYLYCYDNPLTSLDVSGCTALTKLLCYDTQLTSLNVSGCTALTYLYCPNNQLVSMDISGCTALTELYCDFNQLASLNASGCTALTDLSCGNNQLASLDVSGCTALTELHCGNNQLASLDVSGCTALTELYCGNNQLASLDVSGCTALTELYCDFNQLASLNASGCMVLVRLQCYGNQLASLNVSGCTALAQLFCPNNQLASLNVSGCTALAQLYCYDNQLASLDVSGCTALTELYCGNNQLASLDVSGCTALTYLSCGNNQLASLDVSGCTALTELSCDFNQQASLNVSGCTALAQLFCYNNQLTSLDVSGCTALVRLQCYDNQLASLDVSGCTALTDLFCDYNQLVSLDVSGCTALTALSCYNNPLTFLNCSRSKLKGEKMDKLISNLPHNWTDETYQFYVYDNSHSDEGNICTEEQVAAIKAKGWTSYYFDTTDKVWKEYGGATSEEIISAERNQAEAAYNVAMDVYEQFMAYYKNGMDSWGQIEEEWRRNDAKIEAIESDIETLLKSINESGMDDGDKVTYTKALNEMSNTVYVLSMQNKNAHASNNFQYTAEKTLGDINVYADRLAEYKERIEAAVTAEELDALIAEMTQDAENVKSSCLTPIVSDYEGLNPLMQELVQIGKELDALEQTFQSYVDAVNAAITNISGINADAEMVTVYTIDGKWQVLKKNELYLLPRGLYIINGKKHVVK